MRLAIRAEEVSIASSGLSHAPAPDINRLEGKVVGLGAVGPLVTVEIDCGFPLKSYALAPQLRAMALGIGDAVAVEIAPDAVHVMTD